jgi:hypothetical protein
VLEIGNPLLRLCIVEIQNDGFDEKLLVFHLACLDFGLGFASVSQSARQDSKVKSSVRRYVSKDALRTYKRYVATRY